MYLGSLYNAEDGDEDENNNSSAEINTYDQEEILALKTELCKVKEENSNLKTELNKVKEENSNLKSELEKTRQEFKQLSEDHSYVSHNLYKYREKCENLTFGAKKIKDNDKKTNFYTGLPKYALFVMVFNLISKDVKKNQGLT